MGYNVTFHPISRRELQRYVLEVIREPELIDERAAEITDAPDKRFQLRQIFEAMCNTVSQRMDDVAPHPSRLAAFQFWAAQVAGYLHPYWYARNAAMGFLTDERVRTHFAPLSPVGDRERSWLGTLPDCAPVEGNYAGSGFVEDIASLETALLSALESLDGESRGRDATPLLRHDALGAVHDALAYCKANGLGLIEACDVVVPIIGEWSTDPDNLTDADWHDGETAADGLLRFAKPADQPGSSPLDDYIHGRLFLHGDQVAVRRLTHTTRGCTVAFRQAVSFRSGGSAPLPRGRKMITFPNGTTKPVKIGKLQLQERRLSHEARWIQLYEEEADFWVQNAEDDRIAHIDEAAAFAYSGIVSHMFEYGLQMLYAGQAELAERYFENTICAGDYILEQKLTDEAIHRFWQQRAEIALVLQLAKVVRNTNRQDDPDGDEMSRALQGYVRGIDLVSRSAWSESHERDHSVAIALALLVDDRDTALALLHRNRPAGTQYDTRRIFMRCASRPPISTPDRAFVDRCRQYLELVRAPTGGPELSTNRFAVPVFAAVLDKYVFRPGETVDWPAIIERLGR